MLFYFLLKKRKKGRSSHKKEKVPPHCKLTEHQQPRRFSHALSHFFPTTSPSSLPSSFCWGRNRLRAAMWLEPSLTDVGREELNKRATAWVQGEESLFWYGSFWLNESKKIWKLRVSWSAAEMAQSHCSRVPWQGFNVCFSLILFFSERCQNGT